MVPPNRPLLCLAPVLLTREPPCREEQAMSCDIPDDMATSLNMSAALVKAPHVNIINNYTNDSSLEVQRLLRVDGQIPTH